jgi:phosphatidylglycerophosphatase A
MKAKAPATVWTDPRHFLAFGLGSGCLPFMPGTWGTLMAIPFYLLLQDLTPLVYSVILIISTGVGIYLCEVAERDTGVPDHSGIVWDEFVGFWLTMFLAPKGWPWVVLGFGLFRLFDTVKPWPIRWIDSHVKGGFGVMLDDLLAAIPAWLILQSIAWWVRG